MDFGFLFVMCYGLRVMSEISFPEHGNHVLNIRLGVHHLPLRGVAAGRGVWGRELVERFKGLRVERLVPEIGNSLKVV